jgi:hypothetical protein
LLVRCCALLRLLRLLQNILGPLHGLPCQIIQSAADEAVPQALRDNGSVQQLGQRMVEAITLGSKGASSSAAGGDGGRSQPEAATSSSGSVVVPQLHVVSGAGHACAGHGDELVSIVCDFLRQLPLRQ